MSHLRLSGGVGTRRAAVGGGGGGGRLWNSARKGSILGTKAAETQGKGGVAPSVGAGAGVSGGSSLGGAGAAPPPSAGGSCRAGGLP